MLMLSFVNYLRTFVLNVDISSLNVDAITVNVDIYFSHLQFKHAGDDEDKNF